MRKRKFSLVLGAVCVVMGITASSAFTAVDAKPLAKAAAGGTVIFGADQEPRTLNTFTNEGNAAWGRYVVHPGHLGCRLLQQQGRPQMGLLESITLNSKSPQVVTYKIKAAAKWTTASRLRRRHHLRSKRS